jgi:hypothetical protein
MCTWLTAQKPFDYFIIGAIIANCGVMALDVHYPGNDQNPLSIILVRKIVFFCDFILNLIGTN